MKKYAIMFLVPINILLSCFAFVHWDKTYFSNLGNLMFESRNNVNVVVLSSQIKPETNGVLVPVGSTTFSGEVTKIIVEYTLMLNSLVASPMQLQVDIYNITVNSIPNPSNVVKIEVVEPKIIFNSAIKAQLSVSINTQHLSASEYFDVMAQLENSNINYYVSFSAFSI